MKKYGSGVSGEGKTKQHNALIPTEACIPMTQRKRSQIQVVMTTMMMGKRSLVFSHLLMLYSSVGLASHPVGATETGKQFTLILKRCSIREEHLLVSGLS